jgi:outer membrane protein OmpA-like peptidoglycan-associated protein
MKNLRSNSFVLFIFLYFCSVILPAQTDKTKKGSSDYERLSYSKAISKLEPYPKKTTEVKRELAESYYFTGNISKAESYYLDIVTASDAKAEDYYRYSAILRMNGKYAESEKWITQFGQKKASDSRVAEYLLNPMAEKQLLKDEGRFEVMNLDINSSQQDFGPAYLNNKLAFASSREGVKPIERRWNGNGLPFLDIYVGTIEEKGQISNPVSLTNRINKKYHEGPATFSEDGTQMIFTRNNYKEKAVDGSVNLQLFSANLVNGKWINEQPLPFNNKEYSVGHPSLSPDGNTLYFASNMPGGVGGTDIYKSVKQVNGNWSAPENLGEEINTEGNEMFPFYHSSGILFFASDGHVGLGGLDIFLAQKKQNGWEEIKNLGVPVNTNKDDFSFILDKQMKSGYFSSNRDGGKGDDDIYAFNLLKPFSSGKTIKGIAKDKQGTRLSGLVIKLTDEAGKEIATTTTGNDGSYSFPADADKVYKLIGSKESYINGVTDASTKGKDDIVTADIILEKDSGLSLYGIIKEKGSSIALEKVKIKLINNKTRVEEKIVTGPTGDFRKPLTENKLNDRISFNLIMEKEGYLTKTVTYEKLLDKNGQYNIFENIDVALDKVTLGTDLAKLIDIRPILFDLGKYLIRSDASIELDKIVKVMNENPTMVIALGSHTDCRGSSANNEKLSDVRAKASAEYIKARITNPERISGKGYGESQLKNGCACEGAIKSNCSEAEHQENRRTEFIIVKM